MGQRLDLNFGWEFVRACDASFLLGRPCADAERVDLPHTCAVTPYDYFDESVYQMLCGYRKRVFVPEDWRGKRVFLHIGAAAHAAEVFLDGEKLGEHRCGYTAFTVELTKGLTPGKEALISVRLDSRETLDQPPFGFVIDYMTYGGLYREVWLEICNESCVTDVFARPALPEDKPLLALSGREALHPGLARELRVNASLASTVSLSGPVCRDSAGWSIRQRVLDEDGREIAESSLALDGVGRMEWETCFDVPGVGLWDVDSPRLYTLETAVCRGEEVLDSAVTRVGFRRAEWRADGFRLNGRKLRVVGLNRHQSYPYIGYAAPRSLQRLDAEILKNELGCNAVRTSHYPQSPHFVERCDELGLLVFTEIPGWQHIGREAWKQQAVRNVEDMARQYRNHPSIVLWGVRVNESADDDALYAETNAAARRLDPTRATGGVRCTKKSSLLEDVYTYNDFLHDGKAAGCEKKKAVTPDMGKAYLISEYNGHMFPTKTYDSEAHRTEHALRHAAVLDAVAAEPDIAGSFGWCFADYNTHRDFGSGDRVCYHGVLDMFRNPKTAAAVYAARQDLTPVLTVSSEMEIGEQPASNRGRVFVMTNADEVRLYKNEPFIRSYTHADSPYKYMYRPPIEIDDYIGDQIAENEDFAPRQAELVKDILNYAARFGFSRLPPQILAKAGVLMARYGMRYEDAYALYGKYVNNWGDAAASFRFEAVKDGEVVKTVCKTPATALRLEALPSSTMLQHGATYDAALVRLRMTDQEGNTAHFWHGAVSLTIEGPIAILGPKSATLRGGLGGALLRTTGEAGEAVLRLETEQTESVELRFTVETENREGSL